MRRSRAGKSHILLFFTADYGKLRKEIKACMEKIKIDDRIMVVGNSSEPFSPQADVDELKSFFRESSQKKEMCYMFFVPSPDYLSRRKLWIHFIEESVSKLLNFLVRF